MKLTFALTAVLFGATAVLAKEQEKNQSCRKTKVAILGAGVAGITAAQTLANQSVTDFIIVEYQDKIGGRMHDVNFGKKEDGSPYVVEVGANWVQGLGSPGRPENPIYSLAKKYNIKTLVSDYDNYTTYDETGAFDYDDISEEFSDALHQASVQAGSLLKDNIQDRTARGGLRLADWNPERNDSHAQLAEWFNFDSEFIYGPEESSQLFTSVSENATFQYFSEDNLFVYDERGFAAIIRGEAATFLKPNDPRLLLNTIVTGVHYTDNGVTVNTNDGSCIEADYAVMTFSLGVLQHNAIDFEPPLPAWKKSAISSFELGTYTKIFMQFDEAFWDDTQYILWADPHERGYYPQYQPLNLEGVLPGSGILIATVVNKQAYKVEVQTNEETQAEVMAALRKIYGDDIPDPKEIYYPRWSQEPWAYGSFSNWPPSTSLQAHQNLRSNMGRLFFAGEATSQEFFGYLHGAYYEGHSVGEIIATCIQDPGNCTDEDGQARYKTLTGVTPYDMYNDENGWFVDTFLEKKK